MKGPPGYLPKNKTQETELQRKTDELIRKRSKVMGALTDSAPRKYKPVAGKISNLTIDSGGGDQHHLWQSDVRVSRQPYSIVGASS